MLALPLPTKRPNSSSSIAFVPRQIMLDSSSAVVAKERRKEKKKRSSETLHLDRAEDGGASHQEQGRDALLRSIAAFLDVNGFSKTLSVFQSETQLEIGCWKSSFVNLEDLFCKFFDSSNGHAEVSIDWLKDLDLQKVGISGEVEEKIHKKKRKRTNQIDDGIETEDNKTGREKGFGEGDNNGEKLSLDGFQDKCKEKKAVGWGSEGLSSDKSLNENSDHKKLKSADDLHTETKEKKRKKKLVHDSTTEGAEDKHLEVSRETAESIGPANQYKEKKKKHKMMAEVHDEIAEFDDSGKLKEMVKVKTEELVSLTNNSFESNVKHKSEKKKDKKLKQVELEASENTSNKKDKDTKLVGAEGHTGSASKNALDDNDSQRKVRKQKQKSSSKILSTVSSDEAGEGRSSDQLKECDINQDADASDSGHGVPVSEDMNIKLAKKTSKKRTLLDSGGKADNEIASKESKVTSEGAENNEETRNLLKSDKSTLDSDTPVVTKKRKMEESKETTKNAGEQLELSTKSKEHGSASNSKNELVAHQLANGSIGNNGGKEKPSAEPKSVNPFQRVKMDEVKFVDERLKDNSYWAKDGADTGYGAKAQEVLGQVRGRDFRHEKTKKKRGSYRGGQITLQSHSIKFSYSDDDE